MQQILIRRHVVHIGGYDPMPPDAFLRRFNREMARSAGCWNMTATVRHVLQEEHRATWMTEVEGPGWRSETAFELLRWDDVIEAHRSGATASRWLGGIAAFFDFAAHRALWRYLTIAWRYAVFFLYPYTVLSVAFVLALTLTFITMASLQAPATLGLLASLAVGLLVAYLIVARTHVGHLLDDWDFARIMLRHADRDISDRLAATALRMSGIRADTHVLVTGHSLGAVLATDLLRRAVTVPQSSRPYGFLALGSSILKLGLHDKATELRQQLQVINTSGRVTWIEYQSLSDVMNFYKSDPVRLLRIGGPSPVVRQVRFSRMLMPRFYARIKLNFFRLHCQFISGSDKRSPFDYFIACCGPFDPDALARSPDGAMRWLDENGALTAEGRAALLPADNTRAEPGPDAS